jgi:nucleoside-triphosphatase THEP1
MKKKFYILTGKIHSGKTTLVQKLCTALKKENIYINGLLSKAFFTGEVQNGYDGMDIQTGESFPLLRTEGKPSWERIGPYFFIPEGLVKAKKAILNFKESDITVIDEIGPKELEEKGFWPELSYALDHAQKILIVIRETLLSRFILRFKVKPIVFQVDETDIISTILNDLNGERR